VIYAVAAEEQVKVNIFGDILCIITGMRNRNAICRHEKMANFAKMSLNCFSMKLLIL